MRFVEATDTRAAYVRRSLIVRLHLPGPGQGIQRMIEEERDPSEADQDSSMVPVAPPYFTSLTRTTVTTRQRMAQVIDDFTRREAQDGADSGQDRDVGDDDQDIDGA